jgi:hypothetical protein
LRPLVANCPAPRRCRSTGARQSPDGGHSLRTVQPTPASPSVSAVLLVTANVGTGTTNLSALKVHGPPEGLGDPRRSERRTEQIVENAPAALGADRRVVKHAGELSDRFFWQPARWEARFSDVARLQRNRVDERPAEERPGEVDAKTLGFQPAMGLGPEITANCRGDNTELRQDRCDDGGSGHVGVQLARRDLLYKRGGRPGDRREFTVCLGSLGRSGHRNKQSAPGPAVLACGAAAQPSAQPRRHRRRWCILGASQPCTMKIARPRSTVSWSAL